MSIFARTKTYSIFIPKYCEDPIEKMKVVEEGGFTVFAAIFKMFWALYNKMWLCASCLFLAQSLLMFLRIEEILPIQTLIITELGFVALIGFNASSWKQEDLLSKNYVLADVVLAMNELQAKQIFLKSYADEEYYRTSDFAIS